MQTSFMPINEPNLDNEYVLDFGDVLEVQSIGQKSYTKEIEIKRDGSINIDDLGKIFLSGLTLNKAQDLIKAKISEAYLGTSIYISLVNIRDIQVYILGAAAFPGLYTLNGNSSLLHALSMSGGISESGTFREIELKRDGETIKTIDLYELFISGSNNFTERLRSGDVIFIPPAQKIVSVLGGVKRPLFYELKNEESLDQLIKFANGYSATANKAKPVRVTSQLNSTIDLSYVLIDELSRFIPKDLDTVYVESFIFKNISVQGAVKYPGVYSMSLKSRLSDAIMLAGGYREDAYINAGILDNEIAGEVSALGSEFSYKKILEGFLSNGFSGKETDLITLLKDLKPQISKRIIANFDLDLICDNPDLDTFLNDGDVISIPQLTEQVYVYGAVNSPGSIRIRSQSTVKDYIQLKGGFAENADKKLIFIISPNGESKLTSYRKLSLFGQKSNQTILPGSIIFVTPELNLTPVQAASIWAPLVSSFALTLASISSLDK